MQSLSLKILGLRKEFYIGTTVSGHNCDFNYRDTQKERIVFNVIEIGTNDKYELTLSDSEGECGSGWTTASWGHYDLVKVNTFQGHTHKPIREIVIDYYENADDLSDSDCIISVTYNGGDGYYPNGGYYVDMNFFKENVRAKTKRPVWIFKGKSNAGKSFLAHKISGLTVYETDFKPTLPDVIKEDVIVLGNKFIYSVEEIKNKIFGEYELVIVEFS